MKKKRMNQSEMRDRAWQLTQDISYCASEIESTFKDIYWNEDTTVRADIADYLDLNEEFFSHAQNIVRIQTELKSLKKRLRT